MPISRQLAHKLINRMQMVTSAIELDRKRDALDHLRDMAEIVKASVESAEDEKARLKREAEQ